MTNRYFLRFRRFLRDQCGQDMVEYALLAGFVAVSAGAVLPGVAGSLGEIYSKVQSVASEAADDGQSDGDKPPTGEQNEA